MTLQIKYHIDGTLDNPDASVEAVMKTEEYTSGEFGINLESAGVMAFLSNYNLDNSLFTIVRQEQ